MSTTTLALLECKRCDHHWLPRSDKLPVQCPSCKSPRWQTYRRADLCGGCKALLTEIDRKLGKCSQCGREVN